MEANQSALQNPKDFSHKFFPRGLVSSSASMTEYGGSNCRKHCWKKLRLNWIELIATQKMVWKRIEIQW